MTARAQGDGGGVVLSPNTKRPDGAKEAEMAAKIEEVKEEDVLLPIVDHNIPHDEYEEEAFETPKTTQSRWLQETRVEEEEFAFIG